MSSEDNTICRRCGKPTESKSSGFVTQFIEVCMCRLLDNVDASEIQVCQRCGKSVGSRRHGSLSQFIFKPGQCACDIPKLAVQELEVRSSSRPRDSSDPEMEENAEIRADLEEIGFPVNRYIPYAELGSGASGRVYLCKDLHLNKLVAVKLLQVLSREELIAFQNEAKATSVLMHPNIVQVLDFGATENGKPYMVLERVSGLSLDELLKQNGPLNPELAISVCEQLCDALDYSHKQGIFHRDIKPSNILLYDDISDAVALKLIDFGVASTVQTLGSTIEFQGKTLAGTPAYMPPDTIAGLAYDARSEVYSVGCVLFEMLAGFPPFEGSTALETVSMHAHKAPPVLSDVLDLDEVDSAEYYTKLDQILARCLVKKRDERYPSADALRKDLLSIELSGSSQSDERSEADSESKDSNFSNRIALTFALVAIIGMSILTLHQVMKKSPAAPKEEKVVSSATPGGDHAPENVEDARNLLNLAHPDFRGGYDKASKIFLVGPDGRERDLDRLLIDRTPVNIMQFYNSTIPFTRRVAEKIAATRPYTLTLEGVKLNEEVVSILCTNNRLTYLHLDYCKPISRESMSIIAQVPKLKGLSAVGCNLTDEVLAPLSMARKLTQLHIDGNPLLTEKGLENLRRESAEKLTVYIGIKSLTSFNIAENEKRMNELNLKVERLSPGLKSASTKTKTFADMFYGPSDRENTPASRREK